MLIQLIYIINLNYFLLKTIKNYITGHGICQKAHNIKYYELYI